MSKSRACAFAGCDRRTLTDYCRRHRIQLALGRKLQPIIVYAPRGLTLAGRLEWGTVREAAGCWGWRGVKNRSGYATIAEGGGRCLASRARYELEVGPIQPGQVVCHRCDTPACTNPDHLFLGTRADNNRDRASKGRSARGEQSGRAVLTASKVRWIRQNADRRSGRAMATELGVGTSTVHAVINRESWTHLNDDGPVWAGE